MSTPVIQVDNLWKKYRLGVLGTGTLRHDFNRWWHRVRGKPDPYAIVGEERAPRTASKQAPNGSPNPGPAPAASDLSDDEMWALRGVSFEVKQGEILGIIGRNGAGKSTLLKILSRVTAPSRGEVRVKGRIASLLEVGTGFHPDLTGRENIFLNGAILGMTKGEIKRKFDEILAFAEVERYIDTPVKRYSSGMYVRLAFAVAAHLDPEILIVDEVLAVGDAQFQKKCLGKMQDVAKGGRTVLFVSHNLIAVEVLCSSAILLSDGFIQERGSPKNIINRFVSTGANMIPEKIWNFDEAPSSAIVKLHAVRVLNENHKVQSHLNMNKPILIKVEFWVLQKARLSAGFWLYNQQGVNLFATANYQHPAWANLFYEPGLYSAWCTIPAHQLNQGEHFVKVLLLQGTSEILVQVPDAVSFFVNDTGDTRSDFDGPWVGAVRPLLPWDGMRDGELPLKSFNQKTTHEIAYTR